ncbi:MAG: tetratricopeptide repeat protein [Chitinispirillaceae bacterium]|nr:tetratricopeptide repeat protein [Chitinispirillaceae bacterium]
MQIKYSKQKQELREDPVLDGLLKTKEFIRKNGNRIVGSLSVIVLAVAIIMVFNYFQKSRAKNAGESFGKAMVAYSEDRWDDAVDQFRIVTENYRRSVPATMSAYMLGSILYQQGRYDEAITWYEAVQKGASAGFINAQAYEGLAACYEIKADTVAAVKNLEMVLSDDRVRHRHNAARWKIALLTRTSDFMRAKKLCDEIIADSTAQEYRQNAEFLKATLINNTAG